MNKKTFIIWNFLFFLVMCTSCHLTNKQSSISDDYIGVAKVDMICNINKEKSYVTIPIFTTEAIRSLKVYKTLKMTSVEVVKRDGIILKNGKDSRAGFLYEIYIHFKLEELLFTELQIHANGTDYTLNIGKYQSKALPDSKIIATSIDEVKQKDGNYRLDLIVQNKGIQDLYLQTMDVLYKQPSYKITEGTIPNAQMCVYKTKLQLYQHMMLYPNMGYFQIEGILKLKYLTNLDSHIAYASYYVNTLPSLRILQSDGIDIRLLTKKL